MEPQGKKILVRPRRRWFRRLRVTYSTFATMWAVWRSADTRKELGTIMRSGQGWAAKVARIRAHMVVASASEVYSDRTLGRLRLRKQVCACPPGRGHNAPVA